MLEDLESYKRCLDDYEKNIQKDFDNDFFGRMRYVKGYIGKLDNLEEKLGPDMPADLLDRRKQLTSRVQELVKRNSSFMLYALKEIISNPDLMRIMLTDETDSPDLEDAEVQKEAKIWYDSIKKQFAEGSKPMVRKYAEAAKGLDKNYFVALVCLDYYADALSEKENRTPEEESILAFYNNMDELKTHEEKLAKILELVK
jgi:hypothetical protein